jgi:hypothetical protein
MKRFKDKKYTVSYKEMNNQINFNELKQIVLSNDPNEQAEIITKYIDNKIIITGVTDVDRMYIYDEQTITFRKTKITDIQILTTISKLISNSVKALSQLENKEFYQMVVSINIYHKLRFFLSKT